MIPLDDPRLVHHALNYARRGLKVFPIYEPYCGSCSCGDPDCQHPGKHPRSKNGVKDATTDSKKIRNWWKQWPNANIGISTEGMIVIDVDADKQGFVSLEKLETKFSKLPDTWLSDTGGDGAHYLYRRKSLAAKNANGLRPGIDLKTDGGYIVASPSLHVSGKRYRWSPESARELADFPTDWLPLLNNGNGSKDRQRFDTASALAGVSEGQRDNVCWKLACKLRSSDVPFAEALELVLKSAARCTPPFPEKQARQKVERAYQIYQPTQADPGSSGIYRNITGVFAVSKNGTDLDNKLRETLEG